MTRHEVERAGYIHTDHLSASMTRSDSMGNTTDDCGATIHMETTNKQEKQQQHEDMSALSTIAIMRRHTMYDSLMLVKRYRPCIDGYSLEFPTSDMSAHKEFDCCKSKLVSMYLDEDDPIYQRQEKKGGNCLHAHEGEIVYVPMNGLLDRLDGYDRHGIVVDERVYAFAMGVKTAEKFMRTSSMREIQETPPL